MTADQTTTTERRARRVAAGWSVAEAARQADVSTQTWRRWERGEPVRKRTEARCEAVLLEPPVFDPEPEPEWLVQIGTNWTDDGFLSRVEAALLAMNLDQYVSIFLEPWASGTDRSEALFDLLPFRYLDPVALMKVGESVTWVREVAERMTYMAARLVRGEFPVVEASPLIDEIIFVLAVYETHDEVDGMVDCLDFAVDHAPDPTRFAWTQTSRGREDDDWWDLEQKCMLLPGRRWSFSVDPDGQPRIGAPSVHPYEWFEYELFGSPLKTPRS